MLTLCQLLFGSLECDIPKLPQLTKSVEFAKTIEVFDSSKRRQTGDEVRLCNRRCKPGDMKTFGYEPRVHNSQNFKLLFKLERPDLDIWP